MAFEDRGIPSFRQNAFRRVLDALATVAISSLECRREPRRRRSSEVQFDGLLPSTRKERNPAHARFSS